jgi:hypothetical protein
VIAKLKGFVFCDTSKHTERSGDVGTVKPDFVLFESRDEDRGWLFNVKNNEDKLSASYTAHMGRVFLFIEVQTHTDKDFFTDPPHDPLPDYKFTVDTWNQSVKLQDRILALGQNAHYAHVVQTRQFRTCAFSLSISGNTTRILRWDRSGVLVTESFDYKTDPQTLVDFVWQFVKAGRFQQGFDPTATSVDCEVDGRSFTDAITSHLRLQLALGPDTPKEELDTEVSKHYYPKSLTRLVLEHCNILVSRPLWVARAIVGRCTVGYWGVRCDTKEVVFLKDVWRTDVKEVKLEGDNLNCLQQKGVRHVPTIVCHGDVTTEGISALLVYTVRF